MTNNVKAKIDITQSRKWGEKDETITLIRECRELAQKDYKGVPQGTVQEIQNSSYNEMVYTETSTCL